MVLEVTKRTKDILKKTGYKKGILAQDILTEEVPFVHPDIEPIKSSLTRLYPDAFTGMETSEETMTALQTLAGEDSDAFVQSIADLGRNADTETVLRGFGLEDKDINAIFPPITDLLQKALPLQITEKNAYKMADYYSAKPDDLRRSLITAGRNENTEMLVKQLFPEITERELRDYFNPRVPGMPILGQLPTATWIDRVKEIGDNPARLVPFLASGVEIVTLGKLMLIAKDLEEGKEVSREDLLALREYVDRATKDTTWGYEVADVLAQLVPVAGEFITTGGIFTAGKTATVKAGEQALKRIATRTGLRILEGKLAKYGLEIAGTVVGGTLQTIPAGVTRIPASTLQKQLQATLTGDEESVWESAAKSLGEQWVEVVSERTGGWFAPLANPIKGQLTKLALFNAFLKVNPGKNAGGIQKILGRMGYNGVLGEMLEERVADVSHGILFELGLGDQEFRIPSARQLSVELAAFSVPGAAAKILQSTPDLYNKLKPEVKEAIDIAVTELKTQPERGAIELPGKPEEVTPAPEGMLSVSEVAKLETRIPLDLIRKDEKVYLARLTEQIKKEGIKEPIVIRIREDGSRILWDGIHRFIVAQDLGIKNIPVRYIGEGGETLGIGVAPTPAPKPPIIPKAEVVTPTAPAVAIPKAEVVTPTAPIATEVKFTNLKTTDVQRVQGLLGNLPPNVKTGITEIRQQAVRGGSGSQQGGVIKLEADFVDDTFYHEVGHHIYDDLAPTQFPELITEWSKRWKHPQEQFSNSFADYMTGRASPELKAELDSILKKPEVILPKAEAGMPEAGLQPSMIEGVSKEQIVETAIEQTRQTEPVVPPPPTDSTRKVYERIEFEPEHTNFMDKIRRGWHRFNVTMVDEYFAVKQVVDQLKKGGVELSIEENPYLAMRLLKGISGKANVFLEKGTFGKKFWKTEKGKATPNFTGESLETILQEVKDPQVWRDFSTYLVAKRTVQLAGRNIETGITLEDAQSAISELEAKYSNFSNLASRVYKYQDSLLVYANEMGLVSTELLEKLRKFGDYVPFYRVMNELQTKGLMGKKMANIAQPIKKIKGSEREIINPLESIVKNTYVIINSADRNQVGIMLANLVDKFPQITEVFERVKTPIARVAGVTAKELGVEIEGMTEADAESIVDIFRPSFFTRGDEVTVLIDGKKQYFKVDADLRNALLNLDVESLGMLGKIFGAPARWLRAGATLSPDFMIRNPARDQMTAFAYSNYGFIPGVDFLRGLASVISKDADYQLYRASGAEHAMLVSMDREYLQKTFKEIVEGRNFTFYVKHPMELLRIVSELGEKATRLGEFKAGIRRGAMPLEAGYSSRAVSLDFSQMGTTARAVNTLIAFFNANIRGWGRMISSFKEHPVRTSAKVFMGITLPSILLYMVNRDDDRWKEIPQWQKDLFWIVFVGDNIYRIPKPFELGIIFGSMPERFLEWLDNKDSKLFEEAMANLLEAGSPGFIPTAGLPILEWMTNYSFFRGTKLVPSSREKMPPELQYMPYTSEFSKKIGELIKQSPSKIDNLINGYTAGLGRYAVDILDGILKGTGVVPDIPEPSPTLVDTPVIKAFVVRNPYGSSGATVERFYDTLEQFEQGEKYLKEMLELDNEDKFNKFKADHPELLFFYQFSDDPEKEGVFYSATARYLRRVARDLTELRKKQDAIYKDKVMSPEEKRRLIDEIDILKTDVAQKALNLILDDPEALLSTKINEAIGKLGDMIEDSPELSLVEPDINTMKNLWTSLGTTLEAVTPDDLSKLEGIDELAFRYLETKAVKAETDKLPNKWLYEIVPELKAGVTFENYYKSWQSGLFEDADLARLSREEQRLLRDYHKLEAEGKKQFLIDHPELSINPRKAWLESHPKENAMLAIWGQMNLLTKESYDEFQKLVKEWDIAEDALPETLPDNLDVFLLRTAKFRDVESEIDRYSVDREKWKDKIAELKQTKIEGDLEYRDIERKIDILRKETDDIQVEDAIIQSHIDYGRIIDKHGVGSSSAEAMLFRVDNPDYDAFRTDANIWGDQALKPIDQTKIPIWRIDVQWAAQDKTYDTLPEGRARVDYLSKNTDYRVARRQRDFYSLRVPQVTDDLRDRYVGFYELSGKGYVKEHYLLDNPDLEAILTNTQIMGDNVRDKVDPTKVPDKRYDEIYLEYQDLFDEWDSYGQGTSPNYIADKEERADAREGLLLRNPNFQQAIWEQDAYLLFIGQEEFVPDYIGYHKILSVGAPSGQDFWFDDDWYLLDHPEFYKAMVDKEQWKPKDFSKVPPRDVYKLYQIYDAIIGDPDMSKTEARRDFRRHNPKLDAWLFLIGAVDKTIEQYDKDAKMTTAERYARDAAAKRTEIDRLKQEISRKLKALK